jgi:hypothetical protein
VAAGPPRPLMHNPMNMIGNRRNPAGLSEACTGHARLGPASLVLYDVSTLYFEANRGDGFREPGFSRNAAWNRRSPSAC